MSAKKELVMSNRRESYELTQRNRPNTEWPRF
jgi:hypothetical protein